MEEISNKDDAMLYGMVKGIQIRAKQTNEEILLEVESKDMLKANRVAFKFISFKTPASMPPISTKSNTTM